MSKSSKPVQDVSWCWRRLLDSSARDLWTARLEAEGSKSWSFTEKPMRTRVVLEVWSETKAPVTALAAKWGGQIRSVKMSEWATMRPTPPTWIGNKLEIVHDTKRHLRKAGVARLVVPHGLAFGSGEHGTTFMLLRALAGLGDWSGKSVLDLGTGSGVLALATRLFGATKIVATDFDPDSVRTSRQNEALNFKTPLVRWQQQDVLKLKAAVKYDLVLANIFSGILIEAAPRIVACVKDGGQLWLSGILVSQEREVTKAYRGQGMKRVRAYRRGKWVMLALVPARGNVRAR